MSDETPVHVGGPPRHEEIVTTREGAPADELSKMVDTHENFTLQTLAACCSDHSIPRPCKSFTLHTDIGKQDIHEDLKRCYVRADARATKQNKEAKIPSSAAAKAVQEANNAIYCGVAE